MLCSCRKTQIEFSLELLELIDPWQPSWKTHQARFWAERFQNVWGKQHRTAGIWPVTGIEPLSLKLWGSLKSASLSWLWNTIQTLSISWLVETLCKYMLTYVFTFMWGWITKVWIFSEMFFKAAALDQELGKKRQQCLYEREWMWISMTLWEEWMFTCNLWQMGMLMLSFYG